APFHSLPRPPPWSRLFPYTTLFRSIGLAGLLGLASLASRDLQAAPASESEPSWPMYRGGPALLGVASGKLADKLTLLWSFKTGRSEEHTSELQSRSDLVCRLLLEKK